MAQRPATMGNQYQPISSCNCPYCEQLRRGSVSSALAGNGGGGGNGGGYMASASTTDMGYLYKQISDQLNMADFKLLSQESRILKLEGLVKILAKALGVNEEFLNEVGKGGA
jgi:hypothetical protein